MRTSRRLLTSSLAGAALAVAAIASPAVSLAGDTPPAQELSANALALRAPIGKSSTFTGYVKSKDPACRDHRRVQLYRKTSRTSAFVKRVAYNYAELNTDDSASLLSRIWRISVVRSGYYYARIEATDQCTARKSKQLRFTRP